MAQTEDWKAYNIYQDGKMKRYSLLFSINGGAYAILTWVVQNRADAETAGIPLDRLVLTIAIVAAVFSALMGVQNTIAPTAAPITKSFASPSLLGPRIAR